MTRAVFISYRRDDTEGEAGRLYDDLTRAFGEDAVFMDVAGITPGSDFRKAIEDNIACCGVLLAIIGPTWATITGSDGQRRLDNPNDYVRLEIASALRRSMAVIPVLVHDAHMPRHDQLTDDLKDLAYRNSIELTHARWNSDVQLLIQALTAYVHTGKATETEPVHATVPVQLPPPVAAPVQTQTAKSSSRGILAGAIAALVLAGAAAAFFAMHKSEQNPGQGTTSTPASVSVAPAASSPALAPKTISAKPHTPAPGLAGRWTNPDASGKGTLAQLEIVRSAGQYTIHAWALCNPANCDWGTQNATLDGVRAKAVWSLLNENNNGETLGRVATVTISPSGQDLSVLVQNTYAKHPEVTRQLTFIRSK